MYEQLFVHEEEAEKEEQDLCEFACQGIGKSKLDQINLNEGMQSIILVKCTRHVSVFLCVCVHEDVKVHVGACACIYRQEFVFDLRSLYFSSRLRRPLMVNINLLFHFSHA